MWIGWLLPQFLLFGPALFGFRVLVPCDLLAFPGFYLPGSEINSSVSPGDPHLTDLVLAYPMIRDFCASEFRAGRVPHWQPQNFCGTPFIWPKYSPFEMVYSVFPSPVTLAWMEVLQMLCVGTGTWWFLTRSQKYGFWPSAVTSWCVPWIGFFTIWRGFLLSGPVCFLPWLLWSVDGCTSHPFSRRTVFASIFTALVLISGAPDIAGLVLLTSGLRFVWNFVREHINGKSPPETGRSILCMTLCWLSGFLVASPHLLPFVEFASTGSRMMARVEGSEERPPVGLHALPGLMIPEIHGGSRLGLPYLGPSGNLLESSAGGFAGLFMVLMVIPLAFANPKRWSDSAFWLLMALVSVGWIVDMPGLVSVLRWPGFNVLSYNRWTFATAFSLLMMGCAGLEYLYDQTETIRRWFAAPAIFAALTAIWCFYRSVNLPEPLATILPHEVQAGQQPSLTPETLATIQRNFSANLLLCGGLAVFAVVGWLLLMSYRSGRTVLLRTVPIILIAELVWFAAIQIRECEPSKYYPRIPALQRIAESEPGRILGVMCLPANLNRTHNLSDVRGYDGVDSRFITSLLTAVQDPSLKSPSYAATQWYLPQLLQRDDGTICLPPILNMLNTRYLVLRNKPLVNWRVVFHLDDYWVLENPDFVPRAFVPASVRRSVADAQTLQAMKEPDFDARATAFIHSTTELPAEGAEGEAKIIQETPGHVVIRANMKSPGLVILSDSWHPGWSATVDNSPAEVLRTNVALCSVKVPAGEHNLVMTYYPSSLSTAMFAFVCGIGLASLPIVRFRAITG